MVSLNEVPSAVFSLGLGVVFGAVMANILTSLQSTQTGNSTAYNATTNGLSGLGNLFAQYPLAGTVLGFAIIIGIVVVLWYSMRRE